MKTSVEDDDDKDLPPELLDSSDDEPVSRRVELEEQDESDDESEYGSDDDQREEPSWQYEEPEERSAATKRSPESDPVGGRIARGRKEDLEEDLPDTFQAEQTRERGRSRTPPRNWEQNLQHDPDSEPLLKVWDRTGTTCRGKEILERKEEVPDALLAFL